MTKKQLVEMIRRIVKEEFDADGFRNLGIHQQGNELEREFNKKFKTIHFADVNKLGSVQQFIFMDENDDLTVLKQALSFIKGSTHMGGRIGEYEEMPAIILHY